jgi:bacterioferritin-associated ferredoxin
MEEEIDLNNLYSLMRPKKVCLCMSVTEKDLTKAIKSGADTFDKLIEETSATLGCGTCSIQVMMILEREKSSL